MVTFDEPMATQRIQSLDHVAKHDVSHPEKVKSTSIFVRGESSDVKMTR